MSSTVDSEKPTTVLVVLFSPNAETTQVLDNLLKEFQDGLDASVSSNPPDVLCLYRRETSTASQFRLRKNAPKDSSGIHSGSMKDQLESFFQSTEVTNALQANGRTYLIIGAHGSPIPAGLTISILAKAFMELVKAMAPWNWLKPRGPESIWMTMESLRNPSLPTGAAIQPSTRSGSASSTTSGLTITELNNAIKKLHKPPETLILHTCSLSGVESIVELAQVKHHIACESNLKMYMRVSKWFSALEQGMIPLIFTSAVFNSMQSSEINGIFSSHDSADPSKFIAFLNDLGRELSAILSAGDSDKIMGVRTARFESQVPESIELIDLVKFAEQYNDGSHSERVQQIMKEKQHDHKIVLSGGTERGISVFFPRKASGAKVGDLPVGFKNAASDWIAFLEQWV